MKIFTTHDPDCIQACADIALHDRRQLAFVCEDINSNPTLIIFAEHWQRHELADVLRAAADELAHALPVL